MRTDSHARHAHTATHTRTTTTFARPHGQPGLSTVAGLPLTPVHTPPLTHAHPTPCPHCTSQELMSVFLERFPIRIRHIYVIRQPRFFSIVWAVAKLFFKKKLTERVHLLGDDLAALHAAVPAGVLPPEFGGTLVEAPDAAIDRLAAAERGPAASLGGFRLPLSVDRAGVDGLPGAGSLGGPRAAGGPQAVAAVSAPAFAGAAGAAGAGRAQRSTESTLGAPSSGPVSMTAPPHVDRVMDASSTADLALGEPVATLDFGVTDLSSVGVGFA